MNLLHEIGQANRIGICGHIRPDGDAIGACLATWKYVKNALPNSEVTVFMSENPPSIFSNLAGYAEMDYSFHSDEPLDILLVLDVSSPDRLGDAASLFANAAKTINVDHHVSNSGFCDVSEICAEASSTCEVLFDTYDKKYIDNDVAKSLFTGIVHDSGVFQYSNMSRKSFETVGQLIEYDFDGPKIIDETFYQKSYLQNQLLGRALMESILFMDGKCIASHIDRDTLKFYDALPKHLEGIVNQLRLTKGVEVAIFAYELGTMHYKVSLRSNGKVNVADIAVKFGGGGHDRAAGLEINGTYYDALNSLAPYIEEQLDEAK